VSALDGQVGGSEVDPELADERSDEPVGDAATSGVTGGHDAHRSRPEIDGGGSFEEGRRTRREVGGDDR
jgi:hypothetical protein